VNNKLSVIIPSHREIFLQETVDSLLNSSIEEIEVIVCLDYENPEKPLKKDERVKIIQTPKKVGMRRVINIGSHVADGKYIMKCDAHCSFEEGFDVKLKKDCEPNWISVPRRYDLDPDKWSRKRKHRYIDHIYIFPPSIKDGKILPLKATKWRGKLGSEGSSSYREKDRKDILIDDLMSFQGSCYFMHKSHFMKLGGLDYANFGPFGHEATEISLKTWMMGGRVIRNKNTWYAHLRQGKLRLSRGFTSKEYQQAVDHTYNLCFGDWSGKKYDIKYFTDKFQPLDLWPKDGFSEEEVKEFLK